MTSLHRLLVGGGRPWVCQGVPVSKPSAAGNPAPVMPPSVRVAVGVMAVLALLLLSNGILLWIGFDGVVDRIVDAADDLTRDEAETQVVYLSLVPNLVLGSVLALAALFLPRGKKWTLGAGLAATGLLVLVTVAFALLAGGVSVASLLLLVLAIAGLTSLMAGTTRAWLAGAGPA